MAGERIPVVKECMQHKNTKWVVRWLYTVIPALMEGLERQLGPNSVISETVLIDNVRYLIPREELESTNNWCIFPSMLCWDGFHHVFQAIFSTKLYSKGK